MVMKKVSVTLKDGNLAQRLGILMNAHARIQKNEICLIQAKAALMGVKIRSQMDAILASLMK